MAILSRSLPRKSPRLRNPPPDIPLLFHPQQIAWVPDPPLTLFLPPKKPRPLCQVRSPATRSTAQSALPLHLLHRVAAPQSQSNITNRRGGPTKNTENSFQTSTYTPLPLLATRVPLFLQHKLSLHPGPTTHQSHPGANKSSQPSCLLHHLILPR